MERELRTNNTTNNESESLEGFAVSEMIVSGSDNIYFLDRVEDDTIEHVNGHYLPEDDEDEDDEDEDDLVLGNEDDLDEDDLDEDDIDVEIDDDIDEDDIDEDDLLLDADEDVLDDEDEEEDEDL